MEFNAYGVAALGHHANGDWCSCGERVDACWFHVIYHPYVDACKQAKYDAIFADVD